MDPLAWIAVASVLLVLVHLAIVGYLYRKGGETSGMGLFGVDTDAQRSASGMAGADESVDDHEIRCPTCGTPNDDSYRFCRSCVNDLTSRARRASGETNTGRLQS